MTDVVVPGARDVRGTLDGGETDTAVVACPPHPQHRGHRGDPRLETVSDALDTRRMACLRFDYGEWDEGYGEREDARNAIRWAAAEYDRVGVFGFSFGGAIAILAAASIEEPVVGASALAPASRLAADLDAAAVVSDLDPPLQIIYGTRDTTAEWQPVVEQVRALRDRTSERQRRKHGVTVEGLSADHFFLGKHERIGESVAEFFTGAI